MLVELETRRSKSSGAGLGLIGSGFLWGSWPQIKLCYGFGFRMVLVNWGIGGFGFVAKDFGISLKLGLVDLHLGFLLGMDDDGWLGHVVVMFILFDLVMFMFFFFFPL